METLSTHNKQPAKKIMHSWMLLQNHYFFVWSSTIWKEQTACLFQLIDKYYVQAYIYYVNKSMKLLN